MKKFFYLLVFAGFLILFLSSCRTKEICPAYGEVNIEKGSTRS